VVLIIKLIIEKYTFSAIIITNDYIFREKGKRNENYFNDNIETPAEYRDYFDNL
jgi:hypothetical protein